MQALVPPYSYVCKGKIQVFGPHTKYSILLHLYVQVDRSQSPRNFTKYCNAEKFSYDDYLALQLGTSKLGGEWGTTKVIVTPLHCLIHLVFVIFTYL